MTHAWFAAWALALAALMAFAAQPVGINAQIAFAASAVTVMVLIRLLRLRGAFDHVFMAIAAAIFFRYLFWRVTDTLPPVDRPLDLAVGLLLLGAEIYAIGMLAMNFFVVSDPITQPDIELEGPRETWPSVDVLVPSYDEELDIVGTTLAAASRLDYPADRVRVWLLDDGATAEKLAHPDPARRRAAAERGARMRAFCEELGVGYLARERNERAKAGNLNAGLTATTGELVVVLDADHVPTPDFLLRTVGHFQRDPKLFLVQTPHYFVDADPVERNLGLPGMPAESEMFYSVIQRGLDKWNATFFCGSAAVLRRAALDVTDGFSGDTVTEDCETALALHRRGWHSLYVDRAMVAGLQPDTFAAWIGQRTRWAQGMMQVLMLGNPVLGRGLSLSQRLAYLSSSLFWLFPFSRLAFLLSPAAFLLFDLRIYEASAREIGAYTTASLLAGVLVQARLYGRVRWPWMSEVYELVQSPHLARAVLAVMCRPRAPAFSVTAKGETIARGRVSAAAAPVVALVGLLAVTAAAGGLRVAQTGGAETLIVLVTGWAAFNLVVGLLGLGVVTERRERRRHPRLSLDREAMLKIDGAEHAVRLRDGSIGGLQAEIVSGAVPPARGSRTGTLRLSTLGDGTVDSAAAGLPVRIVGGSGTSGASSLRLAFGALDAAQRGAVAGLLLPDSGALERMRRSCQRDRSVPAVTVSLILLAPQQLARFVGRAVGGLATTGMRRVRALRIGADA